MHAYVFMRTCARTRACTCTHQVLHRCIRTYAATYVPTRLRTCTRRFEKVLNDSLGAGKAISKKDLEYAVRCND